MSNLIRISESDDWIVDCDKERGMYRVSYFQDNHFVDEHWFDAYEKNEFDDFFPYTIGDITYYSKKELFEWIINQQKSNKNCLSEALKNYKLVECKLTDEELEEFLDKWNSIGCTSFCINRN